MKFKCFFCLTIFVACLTTSCKKHIKKYIGPHTDIYIAGTIRKYYSQQNKDTMSTAVYWKNGTMVQVSDSLTGSVMVEGMAVHNNDVYVVGDIPRMINRFYGTSSAAYWKNGVLTQLGEGTIKGIAFKGNDVYMAGTAFGKGVEKAICWKNGKAFALGTGRANSIYIDGDDVYIAGSRRYCLELPDQNDKQCNYAATYWKNDEVVALHDTLSGNTNADHIFVDNGNVNIVGYEDPVGSQPVYWVNKQPYSMKPKSGIKCFISGIVIDDNGKYTACGGMYTSHFNWQAIYWGNGRLKSLPHKSSYSRAEATAALGSDIYIVGTDQGKPVYWKNGQLFNFSNEKGWASAIAIVNY